MRRDVKTSYSKYFDLAVIYFQFRWPASSVILVVPLLRRQVRPQAGSILVRIAPLIFENHQRVLSVHREKVQKGPTA